MLPPGYSNPVLAVTPRGNSPLVELSLPRLPVGIADSRLQRLSSSALLTAIKSASFPMALLHGFLDRRSLRRKQGHYTKIAAVCGRSNVKSRLHFSSKRILNLILNRKKLLQRRNETGTRQICRDALTHTNLHSVCCCHVSLLW